MRPVLWVVLLLILSPGVSEGRGLDSDALDRARVWVDGNPILPDSRGGYSWGVVSDSLLAVNGYLVKRLRRELASPYPPGSLSGRVYAAMRRALREGKPPREVAAAGQAVLDEYPSVEGAEISPDGASILVRWAGNPQPERFRVPVAADSSEEAPAAVPDTSVYREGLEHGYLILIMDGGQHEIHVRPEEIPEAIREIRRAVAADTIVPADWVRSPLTPEMAERIRHPLPLVLLREEEE